MAKLFISRREDAFLTPPIGESEPTVITVTDDTGKLTFGPRDARAWGQVEYHLQNYADVDISALKDIFLEVGECLLVTDDRIVKWLESDSSSLIWP